MSAFGIGNMMYVGGILNYGIKLFSLDYSRFQIQNKVAVLYSGKRRTREQLGY